MRRGGLTGTVGDAVDDALACDQRRAQRPDLDSGSGSGGEAADREREHVAGSSGKFEGGVGVGESGRQASPGQLTGSRWRESRAGGADMTSDSTFPTAAHFSRTRQCPSPLEHRVSLLRMA